MASRLKDVNVMECVGNLLYYDIFFSENRTRRGGSRTTKYSRVADCSRVFHLVQGPVIVEACHVLSRPREHSSTLVQRGLYCSKNATEYSTICGGLAASVGEEKPEARLLTNVEPLSAKVFQFVGVVCRP